MNNSINSFAPVVKLIQSSRNAALRSVNKALIELYWKIGQYISQRVASEDWGKGVVTDLAQYIAHTEPSSTGFTDKNLWRMKQFYETYKDSSILATAWRELKDEKLAAVRRELDIAATPLSELSWSHHRTIFGRCEKEEERLFYIRLAIQEGYVLNAIPVYSYSCTTGVSLIRCFTACSIHCRFGFVLFSKR